MHNALHPNKWAITKAGKYIGIAQNQCLFFICKFPNPIQTSNFLVSYFTKFLYVNVTIQPVINVYTPRSLTYLVGLIKSLPIRRE